MKRLSKIKLQNAVQLENSEMKQIYGGSGINGPSRFSCRCESNLRLPWEEYFLNEQQMYDSIERNCGGSGANGNGKCVKIS